MTFTYHNQVFTEHSNGPYGPYEHLLKDISPTYAQTCRFVTNARFLKNKPCPKLCERVSLEQTLREAAQRENNCLTYSGRLLTQSGPHLIHYSSI